MNAPQKLLRKEDYRLITGQGNLPLIGITTTCATHI